MDDKAVATRDYDAACVILTQAEGRATKARRELEEAEMVERLARYSCQAAWEVKRNA